MICPVLPISASICCSWCVLLASSDAMVSDNLCVQGTEQYPRENDYSEVRDYHIQYCLHLKQLS